MFQSKTYTQPSPPLHTEGAVANLHLAFNYLQEVVVSRLSAHFNRAAATVAMPVFQQGGTTSFDTFLANFKPDEAELITALSALVPHVYPHFFDTLVGQFLTTGGDLPEFGGIKSERTRTFLPTGETILFLLAGNDLDERLARQQWLRENRLFNNDRILTLDRPLSHEPLMSGRLMMDAEFVEWFTTGKVSLEKDSRAQP